MSEETDNVPLADSSEFASLIKAMRRRHDKQIDIHDRGESSQTPPRKQKACRNGRHEKSSLVDILEDHEIRSNSENRHTRNMTKRGMKIESEHRRGKRPRTGDEKQKKACRNCRRLQNSMERPKFEELPHVPEGCAYLPMHTWVDEDGHYHEMLSDRFVGMSCCRCDTRGDHWDTSCPNPINDPPQTDEEAKNTLSWKYILRNFRPTRSVVHRAKLQKQRLAEFEQSNCFFYPKCSKCQDRERKERPPLPRGMGYMPHIYTDKRGRYRVRYSDDQVVPMSCFRCGKMGDHWDIHCPDPINDPESPDNRVAPGLCWKAICKDINAASH